MLMNYHFFVATSLHSKIALKLTRWLLRKASLIVICKIPWARPRNDIDPQYSHIFINPISVRSQAAIVSEKCDFSHFPTEKLKLQFDLDVK